MLKVILRTGYIIHIIFVHTLYAAHALRHHVHFGTQDAHSLRETLYSKLHTGRDKKKHSYGYSQSVKRQYNQSCGVGMSCSFALVHILTTWDITYAIVSKIRKCNLI